jgi:FHS family L-fucose permease-like MFS transporter
MLNTVVNPMLNTLGGGGKKGNQLIQFGGSINSIGATIVPVLVGYLIGNVATATIKDANPALFIAMGIFALAFIVLYFVNIPEPHMVSKEKAKIKHKHSALSFQHFTLGIIAIFVYVGVEVGIPNTTNLFMTSSGDGGLNISAIMAGTVVGTYWFLMLIGRLTGASLGAKISSRAMLIFAATLAIIFLLIAIFSPLTATVKMPVFRSDISFGLTEVPISIMFLILVGICTSVMWGSIFNLAVEGLGKYTAMASGIFMVMVCGGGILPMIQGFIADKFGYLSSYWVIVVGVAYILFYALIGSKNVNKNIPVE